MRRAAGSRQAEHSEGRCLNNRSQTSRAFFDLIRERLDEAGLARRLRDDRIGEMEGDPDDLARMVFEMMGHAAEPTAPGASLFGAFCEVNDGVMFHPARNEREFLTRLACCGLAVVLGVERDIVGALESLAHLNDSALAAGFTDLLWAHEVEHAASAGGMRVWASGVELVMDQLDAARAARWRGWMEGLK